MEFEWDAQKAASNLSKHGVSFEEASSVFHDRLHELYLDVAHAEEEVRFIIIGVSSSRRLLVVAFTQRGETIRVISARKAVARERKIYEEET
jgi:uncharacterized protein